MKLTIGMAVVDDYDGVYFTVQALRMFHPEVMDRVELIVIDNMPNSKASPPLKNLMENWVKGTAGSRYIPMDEKHGTTQPRNRIFDEAIGDAVMCLDSHVLLAPGSLKRLLQFYTDHPDCGDLIQGPMLYDDLNSVNTHFDNFWRAEMWGIWGTAWGCPCGEMFTVLQDKQGNCDFRKLSFEMESYITDTPKCRCGQPLPFGHFAGHQQRMVEAGFYNLGAGNDNVFAIPGQGLGLFTCMKYAWLGFNPHMRGFGGEEMYIHEKYRRNKRQALCHSYLKWGHRFGRPNGIPYSKILTRWNKIRNYVLGAQEIGLPLEPIYQHFVAGGMMPQWEWDSLIKDPISQEKGPTDQPPGMLSPPKKSCGGGRQQPRATINSEGELLAWAKGLPRDLDQHMDTIAKYAARCDVAVELSKRRESLIPLLQVKEKVYSFISEMDPLSTRVADIFPAKVDVTYVADPDKYIPTVPDCDLIFMSFVHDAAHLMKVLEHCGPRINKYIILHNTAYYGEQNRDDPNRPKAGLLPAMRVFLRADPQWSVIYHTNDQFGLTVLSKVEEDKPKLPSMITMAVNLSKFAAKYASDGLVNVTKDEYEKRLEVCTLCPQRSDDRCSVCGCFLQSKASPRISECPLGMWPVQDPKLVNAAIAAAQTTQPA